MIIRSGMRGLLLLMFLCCHSVWAGEEQDETLQFILEILRGDDAAMQSVAIASVKEMPGEAVTKALAGELARLPAAAQVQLLSVLGDRGDAAAVPAVVNAVRSPNESVRVEALKALGQLGDDSVVMLLAERAGGARGDEQKAARDSLSRLKGSRVDAVILGGLAKAEPKTKVELIGSVGRRNIVAGLKNLLETAKDPDRKVRIESLKVLKVIAGPGDMAALVELLLNVRSASDRGEAEKTVAVVAHKIEDKNRQAEVVLRVLPSVKDAAKRSSLVSVLGRIGDNSALGVLRKELDGKDAEVRTAAVRALSSWPTSEPLADLLGLARDSKDPLHRTLALRGFVRLLALDGGRTAEETAAMYEQAMSLAPNAMEKRRVLSGLAGAPSVATLKMAAGYLEDKELVREAEVASVEIAAEIWSSFGGESSDVLKKIVATTKNESVRQRARELIDRIEGVKGREEG
ncbi:MAG: HEAT repeat domain-containing protein [Phycisphaerales bacterium]|nr:MAG: HEAT repeat domain-containing protein [Phycisphaerales bacterium]